MKNRGHGINTPEQTIRIEPTDPWMLEVYFFLAAGINFLACALALGLCNAFGLGYKPLIAVYIITNPLWAHLRLWWRRK